MTLQERFEQMIATSDTLKSLVDNVTTTDDNVVKFRWDGLLTCGFIEVDDGTVYDISDTMDFSRWHVLLNGHRHQSLEALRDHMLEACGVSA